MVTPHLQVDAPFWQRYWRAVSNPRLRRNLLAFQRGWRESRDARFRELGASVGLTGAEEFELLRKRLAAAKDEVIRSQGRYVAQFKECAVANGATVYEASSPEDAARYVEAVCRRLGSDLVVKTKSMVGEEIHLNHVLAERGIRVVESDLGEWIVQLRGETPSHMVMPAIHLSRRQVGDVLSDATGRPVSRDDVAEQVGVSRTAMRRDFLTTQVGLTGANALIAESGTLMLVTNEGNEALVTTLPRAHVVLAGYDKLVPTFDDAMTQVRLLARSGTGQAITTYTTFITGPDRPDREVHYVIVDNGRSAMRDDPDFAAALRCIRCAACASVCPPYQIVGGHVFGYIYSGAIGLVNTPFHHGLERDAGPQSLCVSCNACQTVCPVDIPLPRQILDVRRKVVEMYGLPPLKRLLVEVWSRPHLFRALAAAASLATRPVARSGLLHVPLPPRHAWRTPPALAEEPARRLVPMVVPPAAAGPLAQSEARGLTVAYALQCLTDVLAPEQAQATVRLLAACGARVVVPQGQHCCGLPMLDAGDAGLAKRLAKRTIRLFESYGADYVVSEANSCVVAIAHDYAHLLRDEPAWQARAQLLAERVVDLATFLVAVAKLPDGALVAPALQASRSEHASSLAGARLAGDAALGQRDARSGGAVYTYHPFCQTRNVLRADGAALRLLRDVCGLEIRELPEASVCCGFGGSTSVDAPEVGRGIVERKLANVDSTGATILVTDNPGCVVHLRGAAAASGRPLEVRHLVRVLAERLDALEGRYPDDYPRDGDTLQLRSQR